MIDLVIGFALALLLLRGWFRGFVRESFDLLGLVVGVLAAFRLSPPFGAVIEASVGLSSGWARVAAGGLIFVAVGLGAALLAGWLHRVASLPGLNLLNRAGGAGVAVGWGLVLATLLLSLLVLVPVPVVVAEQLETSAVTGALTDPEGVPQRVLHTVSGDRVVTNLLGLRRVTGSQRVIVESDERVELDPVAGTDVLRNQKAARDVYRLLNRARVDEGLDPLVWSDLQAGVGAAHALEMYRDGYFAHRSPVTGTVGDRLRAAGLRPELAGENLALAAGAAEVHSGLMGSEGHRANILDPRFRSVGIAVVEGPLGLMTVQVFSG